MHNLQVLIGTDISTLSREGNQVQGGYAAILPEPIPGPNPVFQLVPEPPIPIDQLQAVIGHHVLVPRPQPRPQPPAPEGDVDHSVQPSEAQECSIMSCYQNTLESEPDVVCRKTHKCSFCQQGHIQ